MSTYKVISDFYQSSDFMISSTVYEISLNVGPLSCMLVFGPRLTRNRAYQKRVTDVRNGPHQGSNIKRMSNSGLSRTSTAGEGRNHPQITHGMISLWVYIMRTIPNIGPLFQPLEDTICLRLIPALTGYSAWMRHSLFTLLPWWSWYCDPRDIRSWLSICCFYQGYRLSKIFNYYPVCEPTAWCYFH